MHAYADAVRRPGAGARRAAPRGLDLFVLDAPHLFDRPGNPYLGADGRDWPDNALRFAALARVGADIAKGASPASRPTSSTPTTGRRRWRRPISITTAARGPATRPDHPQHRLPGPFPAACSPRSACRRAPSTIDGVEYFGGVGFLKGGLRLADRITTVSPTYAREIMTPEFGMALDGLLRARADVVEGIVNGIDDDGLEPRDRPDARRRPTARCASTCAPRNKAALQQRFGLDGRRRRAAVRRRLAA